MLSIFLEIGRAPRAARTRRSALAALAVLGVDALPFRALALLDDLEVALRGIVVPARVEAVARTLRREVLVVSGVEFRLSSDGDDGASRPRPKSLEKNRRGRGTPSVAFSSQRMT